jgi:hypothetical protein
MRKDAVARSTVNPSGCGEEHFNDVGVLRRPVAASTVCAESESLESRRPSVPGGGALFCHETIVPFVMLSPMLGTFMTDDAPASGKCGDCA